MNKYSDLEEELEKPIDFLGIFYKYISYWKWIIASLIICVAIAEVYLRVTTPYYQVTTSVLLKDDQKGNGTPEMNAFKEMGLLSVKNNVDNELEMLKTTTLTEEVVREMGIYTSYKRIGTFQIFTKPGIDEKYTRIRTFNNKVLYGSECPLLISLPDAVLDTLNTDIKFEVLVHPSGVYEFTGNYLNNSYNVKASISDKQVVLPFGKILIKRGNFRPANDMEIAIILQDPTKCADEITQQLQMELTTKTTSVVKITFNTTNVNLGKDFLKKLIEAYNREDLNDQITIGNKTAQFIDDRLMTLTRELGDVEAKVENYKQVQGLTDINSQSAMYVQQTGDYAQKRLEVGTQLSIISDIDDYMHKKENRYQLIPVSSGIKSQDLNELINNYNKLLLQRNRLSRIASNNNQVMIDLTNQIESMFSTVQSSVRNEKRNWQITQQDISNKSNENTARIRAIPRQEREYTEIKRQQGVKEALFLYLLQKKEEKYLNTSVVAPIAKIIDTSRSDGNPISPKRMIILLISIIIGLIIPVIGIKIRDLLRYQVENKEELEKLSIVPVLGEILKSEDKNDVIIRENSTDSFTELVRLLRTNLLFVLDSPEKKVINMVSSMAGEGKTLVSINLAMSLALLDKKVLLIGLDIRKPKLDEYLGMDNTTGITLFLAGHMNQHELIRPSGIHPGLFVITAGPKPPNPSELLAKPALDELITELRKQFDYIVIDTAPLGVVSDSFSLNRMSDVNLYVVRADFTPKKSIEEATNLFINKKLKNMYFVLNAIDRKKNTYRHGYGKKYIDGYGYETESRKKKK
ncbi:MAG: polysaccharide biosynthesis tyrosine autokinase [Bacteroidota bacterium]|nr:polysaccharide biosynthesis tyrosine autokinase [Bacteroidota bacterium]